MPDVLDIHEFFVEGGDQRSSHVLLHITEPSTPEEQAKGYFFALCELNGADESRIEHLQRIIDQLESRYYASDDSGDKKAFEQALETVNRRGHHVLSDAAVEAHCVVGVIAGHELSVSYHGAPDVRVIYSKDDSPASLSLVAERVEADQLFSSLMSGTVQSGDRIYAATPHVGEYVTSDRVEKIVGSRPPAEASTHLQKVLSDLNNGLSFGGIIFHVSSDAPRTGRRPKYLTDTTEAEAPKISVADPAPSLLERAKSRLTAYGDARQRAPARRRAGAETNYRPRAPRRQLLPALERALIIIGKAVVVSLRGLARLFRGIVVGTARILVALFLISTNKAGQRSQVLDQLRAAVARKKQAIGQLPLLTKLLFFLMLASGCIFAVSVGVLKIKAAANDRAAAYTTQAQAIMDKKSAAEAAMIYGDTERASSLLHEAEALTAALPKRTDAEKQAAARWQEEIKTSLTTLRHVRTIQPELIADLAAGGRTPSATRLIGLDGRLAAYGPDDNTLYVLDPVTKQVERKDHDTLPRFISANTPKEQDGILFFRPDNSLALFDKKTGQFRVLDMPPPKKESHIVTGVIYNQRLYTLDPGTSQLYRHNRTQTGYDKGAPWIKSGGADVSGASALAIDGDMFVLTANGLLKFAAGQPADFQLQGVDPPLDRPSAIWTYSDVNNLYITEPANKRLIVLDKNGKLKEQYTAEVWKHPTDMVIDEAKKTAYVIDSNKIYRFKLE